MPRAPSPASGVTSRGGMSSVPWAGITLPSSLLRAHAPVLNPPPPWVSLVRPVCAGCCQPLLGGGPSRRYLCESFSVCLDPYPAAPGALARFFPQDNGLPDGGPGRRSQYPTQQLPYGAFSGLQSFTHVQARRLARHPGCTYRSTSAHRAAVASTPDLCGLLPPRAVDLLTVLNRATDGRGTFTLRIGSLVGCSPRHNDFRGVG